MLRRTSRAARAAVRKAPAIQYRAWYSIDFNVLRTAASAPSGIIAAEDAAGPTPENRRMNDSATASNLLKYWAYVIFIELLTEISACLSVLLHQIRNVRL
jgi:hypothetical protein